MSYINIWNDWSYRTPPLHYLDTLHPDNWGPVAINISMFQNAYIYDDI